MIECSSCHVINQQGAQFCAKCGERLALAPTQPPLENNPLLKAPAQDAVPRRPSARLRSPLLQSDELTDNFDQSGIRESAFPHRETNLSAKISPSAKPVKTGQGLRSPLLGQDQVQNQPGEPTVRSRLHSPVLDGLRENKGVINSDTEVEEIVDANVLRSPLLAARVPIPDKDKPNNLGKGMLKQAEAKQLGEWTKPEVPPAGNGLSLPAAGHFLSQAEGIPAPAVSPAGIWASTGMAGQERSTNAAVKEVDSHLVQALPVQKPDYFAAPLAEPSSQQKEEGNVFGTAVKASSVSRPHLLAKLDQAGESGPNKDRKLSHSLMITLIAIAVGAKAFYLYAMGQAALSSQPFLFDQLAQLLVIVCLIIFM